MLLVGSNDRVLEEPAFPPPPLCCGGMKCSRSRSVSSLDVRAFVFVEMGCHPSLTPRVGEGLKSRWVRDWSCLGEGVGVPKGGHWGPPRSGGGRLACVLGFAAYSGHSSSLSRRLASQVKKWTHLAPLAALAFTEISERRILPQRISEPFPKLSVQPRAQPLAHIQPANEAVLTRNQPII